MQESYRLPGRTRPNLSHSRSARANEAFVRAGSIAASSTTIAWQTDIAPTWDTKKLTLSAGATKR